MGFEWHTLIFIFGKGKGVHENILIKPHIIVSPIDYFDIFFAQNLKRS